MTFNFKTGNVSVYPSGEVALLLNLPREYQKDVNEINKLIESDKLKTIELKQFKEKRSLDSNAYCWVLIDKIAKKLGTTDEEVYIKMLKRYGTKDYVAALEDAKPILEKVYKIVEAISDCSINDKTGKTFRLIRGSSTYDSLEMSQLINGIVDEAKTLGIETATPNEIAELMAKWEVK